MRKIKRVQYTLFLSRRIWHFEYWKQSYVFICAVEMIQSLMIILVTGGRGTGVWKL